MEFNKSFYSGTVPGAGGVARCVIKSDNPNTSYAYFSELVSEAKSDFPTLNDNEILIHHGYEGIIFTPIGEIPESYNQNL